MPLSGMCQQTGSFHIGEDQGWLLLFDALTKNLSLIKLYSGSPELFISQMEISVFRFWVVFFFFYLFICLYFQCSQTWFIQSPSYS